MVPILSGNLGVEFLMASVAGRPLPAPGSHGEELRRMRDLGVRGVEDYVGWGAVERAPDRFDFSFQRRNLEQCRVLDLGWIVYAWVHVVPDWYRRAGRVESSRCLEHDQECGWPSIFAASTLELYERMFAGLAAEFGDELDGLCVAAPADYGEFGYPTGIGLWVAPLPKPVDHVHVGFWCGDHHARAAFDRFVTERHGSRSRVERAFGLRLERSAAIPLPTAESEHQHRLTFADFYLDSMTQFLGQVLGRARRSFPRTPLTFKIGHGGESLAYGIDPTALAEVASGYGARLRSTQATLPEFHHQRLSAPCQHFGVRFETESPTDVGREQVLPRLFADAANGASAYFDFPEHLVAGRDLLDRFDDVVDGDLPFRDVAVLFPSTDQRLHPEWGLPPILYQLADGLRQRVDHSLIDEILIARGGLEGVRVLAILEGENVPHSTQSQIVAALHAGLWLVVGPQPASALRGPLAEWIARAPDADHVLEWSGRPQPCVEWDLGARGDLLRLSGDWFAPEPARQFGGQVREGEWCRWTGAQASLWLPVTPGEDHLLEVQAWIHPSTVSLRHEIRVEGSCLEELTRPGLQRFAAWIDGARLRRSVAEIAFACETFQATQIGIGDDQRSLGCNVIWVRVTRRGTAALESPRAGEIVATVPADRRDAAGLSVGEGRLVVSRNRPYLSTLQWVTLAAQSRSAANAPWLAHPQSPGVLFARRKHSVLLHQTRAEHVVVTLATASGPRRVELEPGAIAVVPME